MSVSNSGVFGTQSPLSKRVVAACMHQMLKGLEILASNNIIHCELNLDNVLVLQSPFEGDSYKIVKFDNAKLAGTKAYPIFQSEKERKSAFVAPEIAFPEPNGRLTYAADIWSLGMIALNLRTAEIPDFRDGSTSQGEDTFPESIINSEKYSRLFDANERDFLI